MIAQHFAATLVDHPRRRAHLRVVIRSDVIHDKVHEASLFLEQREERDDLRFGLVCGGSGRWNGSRCR